MMNSHSLITWMLEPNPKERSTIKEIANHPWITQDVSDRLEQIFEDPSWASASKGQVQFSPADVVDEAGEDSTDDEIDQVSKVCGASPCACVYITLIGAATLRQDHGRGGAAQ